MKKLIGSIVITAMTLAIAAPAKADVEALNMKADELELENEVETIEQFGEAAAAEEAKSETARLTRETRELENEIAKLKRANERAQDKAVRLNELYKKKAKLANDIKIQANAAEARKSRSEKEVARIKAKVASREQAAIRAVEKRKAADQRLAQLKSEKRDLQRRLVVADRVIKKNDAQRKALRAKSLRLSKANMLLKRKVTRAESRSARL
jgi:DNA repair exonuclease SbcCD ATPase subunit